MKRRTLIFGSAAAASGAAVIGSGAFTSVAAERDVSVDVAGDADAFLGLTASDGPNGQYATGAADGTLELDFSDENDDIEGGGEGLNQEAITVAQDVFEIQNQGTQEIEVDFEGTAGDPVVFPEENVFLFLLPEDASLPFPLELGEGEAQTMSVVAGVFEDFTAPDTGEEYTIIAEATDS